MASIKVNDTAVRKKLAEIANAQNLRPAMDEAVELVYEVTQDQPQKKPGAFSSLATPGQRRAYWAKVRSGEARHGAGGYIRSGNLKRGWQKRVRALKTKLKGVVFSTKPRYNVYVQGAKIQPFHKASRWETDKEIAKRNEGAIAAIFDEALKNLVK